MLSTIRLTPIENTSPPLAVCVINEKPFIGPVSLQDLSAGVISIANIEHDYEVPIGIVRITIDSVVWLQYVEGFPSYEHRDWSVLVFPLEEYNQLFHNTTGLTQPTKKETEFILSYINDNLPAYQLAEYMVPDAPNGASARQFAKQLKRWFSPDECCLSIAPAPPFSWISYEIGIHEQPPIIIDLSSEKRMIRLMSPNLFPCWLEFEPLKAS